MENTDNHCCNEAAGPYSSVFGLSALAREFAQFTISGGHGSLGGLSPPFHTLGLSQTSIIVVNAVTDGIGSQEMRTTAADRGPITLPPNSTFFVEVSCVARYQGAITNATASFIQEGYLLTHSDPTPLSVIPSINTAPGTVGTLALTVDVAGQVTITVTGATENPVGWVATLRMTECVY
jgi:hypothetical protein